MRQRQDSAAAGEGQPCGDTADGPTCVILFVRLPERGQVKTRLRGALDAEQILRLYEAFVLDSASLLAACPAQRRVVACSPPAAVAAMRRVLGGCGAFEYQAQQGADLGERLAAALDQAFASGAERAVLIGADTPSLPAAHLTEGLALLSRRDVVLGPSVDGGYYLVGARAGRHAGLFEGIEWSTPRVLQQTLGRLAGRSLGLLPVWYDVDTPEDLRLLATHLEALAVAGSAPAPRTRATLGGLRLTSP